MMMILLLRYERCAITTNSVLSPLFFVIRDGRIILVIAGSAASASAEEHYRVFISIFSWDTELFVVIVDVVIVVSVGYYWIV